VPPVFDAVDRMAAGIALLCRRALSREIEPIGAAVISLARCAGA
jgi:hypothetical protein